MRATWRSTTLFAAFVLLLAACGTTEATPSVAESVAASVAASVPETSDCGDEALSGPVAISFQLQWTPQAQFAGYFAAKELGYYADAGLDVEILDGGPTIPPQQVVAPEDGPELGEGWVPKVLVANEEGADLVNIAQVFQRSGTLEVS
jgi:NitT/TauT family transport system substrate-binding protein